MHLVCVREEKVELDLQREKVPSGHRSTGATFRSGKTSNIEGISTNETTTFRSSSTCSETIDSFSLTFEKRRRNLKRTRAARRVGVFSLLANSDEQH